MNNGWTGIEKDYPVSIQDVINITAETGALTTQSRIRELKPYKLPKRKTGHWVKDEKSYAGPGLSNYLCDQCGECGGTWRSDLKPHQFPKFCMWCGAKMKINTCKDCYWYSDVTVKTCQHEHEPANPDDEACDFFEV